MANFNLDVFDKLCYRAKELVFETLSKNHISFYYVCEVPIETTSLSPIEQIFVVAHEILSYYNSGIMFTLEPQVLVGKDKKYRADFLVEFYYKDGIEFVLDKPLIVELDGFDHHSNKKQMNYDYKRENELKSEGYDIIRFTGSQVYNEPLKCVETIYNIISKSKNENNIKEV